MGKAGFVAPAAKLTLFVLPFLSVSALASWQTLGPFGGSAEAVVIAPDDPDVLVAATRNGLIYRSKDAGSHWSALGSPSASLSVRVMKVSATSVPSYFVGGVPSDPWDAPLYRSSDRGSSWQPVSGLSAKAVYSLAVWKKDPNIIAAGCDSGVFLSEDAGLTWKHISPTEIRELQFVTSLAIDPEARENIYAGTAHLPWKTEDGGKSWVSISKGMLDDSDVFSIEIDPVNTSRILASACSGIYLSENGGKLWTKVLGVPNTSRRTYTIRRDPEHLQTLYAGTSQGLWKSDNGGVRWTKISGAIVKSIAFDPGRTVFYLATENSGLLKSQDQGKTLLPINDGFVNRNLKSLAASKNGLVASSPYDQTGSNLYQMSFAGKWITVMPPAGVKPANLLSLSSTSETSLVGVSSNGGVRTADGGKTWVRVSGERGRVQAIHAVSSSSFLMGTSHGLFRTENAGVRWTTLFPGISVTGIFASGNQIIADAGDRLFVSEDAGLTWTPAPSPVEPNEIYGIALGAQRVLLAATARGAFRSEDGGSTWQPIAQLSGTVRAVAFDPKGTAAVAAHRDTVYRSVDAGKNWSPLDMTGIEGTTILTLVIPEPQPNFVFVATLGRGVFVSPLTETVVQLPPSGLVATNDLALNNPTPIQ